MNTEEAQTIQELIDIYKKRLYVLEKTSAKYGINCPPEITIEIEDINEKITSFERRVHLGTISAYHEGRTIAQSFKYDLDDIEHKMSKIVINEQRVYRFLGIPIWSVSVVVYQTLQALMPLIGIGVVIILLGFAVTTTGVELPSPVKATPRPFQTTIPIASDNWIHTGIYVSVGDTIDIRDEGTSTWTINYNSGKDPKTNGMGYSDRREKCAPLPNENTGGLIGRIGQHSDRAFWVGIENRIVSEFEGPLYLAINDCGLPKDGGFTLNDGHLDVTILVNPSK